MKACRGARWLGWAALLLGVVVGGLRAQTDGSLRWAFAGGSTGSTLIASPPSVGPDGTIYFGVEVNTLTPSGRFFALGADGVQKWKFEAPHFVDSAPALGSDGTVYFGCWDGKLYARNSATGARKWEYATGSYIVGSPAVALNGTIYFGSGDGALHALSRDGVQLWSYQTERAIESSPAIAPDGSICFGSIDRSVYCVNPDGTLKWRVPTLASVNSSPAIGAEGVVYVGSYDGNIYAISAAGEIKWTFRTNGQVSASPVLGADGAIYIGSEDASFYSINPDGTERWRVGVGGPIVGSAAIRSDGTIIFGAYDGVIRAINPEKGLIKWAYRTGDPVESSPVVSPVDGNVYVGSLDGKLYSFTGSGAAASGYSRWPMFRHDAVRSGAAPVLADGGRLVNLATRAQAGDGTALIAGLVTKGDAPKNYLLRAVGPTLDQLGVTNPLADPTLEIRALASDAVLFANDNWNAAGNASAIRSVSASVGAFALAEGSKDAAVLGTLGPGAYTASLNGNGAGAGVALIEAYDTGGGTNSARLINLSTRAQVGTGDRVLIPGLVVGGSAPLRVLVRAVGPGLGNFGVSGALARPSMSVYSGATPILSNAGWSTTPFKGDVMGAAAVVGAFSLVEGSADCAALLTLEPGNYTIQVSGVGGTTGEALVEVYVLP